MWSFLIYLITPSSSTIMHSVDYTATEESCFLRGPCLDVISRTSFYTVQDLPGWGSLKNRDIKYAHESRGIQI
jgi:hypothetical protein